MKGALILTVAAFVIKVLSAVYRVPFQNIVGDVGFYIYQQVYPFYGIALGLSTFGFPVMISKLVAEKNKREDIRFIISTSFLFISIIGGLLFTFTYFGAPFIAKWMGDSHLTGLIQTISFSFLIMPFVSVIRGFYQGKGQMVPSAVSQVTEQSIRVTTILLLSYILVSHGYSFYLVGKGALLGSILGGLGGMFVLFFYIRQNRFSPSYPKTSSLKRRTIWKRLAFQGILICLSSMILVLYQLVDALNLYFGLVKSGLSPLDAKIEKGIYDRGQPLLQLGTIVATSISLIIVPMIATAFERDHMAAVKKYVQMSLKVSFVVGVGAAIGLVNIMKPINQMLFENTNGSHVLAVFCLSILFSSLILTLSAVLQGVGEFFTPAWAIALGLLLKYVGNQLLITKLGTMGASVSTVLSMLIVSFILWWKIKRKFPLKVFTNEMIKKCLLATMMMTVSIQLWIMMLSYFPFIADDRLHSTFISISSVVIGGIMFVYSVLKSGVFKENELAFLPYGHQLVLISNKIYKRG